MDCTFFLPLYFSFCFLPLFIQCNIHRLTTSFVALLLMRFDESEKLLTQNVGRRCARRSEWGKRGSFNALWFCYFGLISIYERRKPCKSHRLFISLQATSKFERLLPFENRKSDQQNLLASSIFLFGWWRCDKLIVSDFSVCSAAILHSQQRTYGGGWGTEHRKEKKMKQDIENQFWGSVTHPHTEKTSWLRIQITFRVMKWNEMLGLWDY